MKTVESGRAVHTQTLDGIHCRQHCWNSLALAKTMQEEAQFWLPPKAKSEDLQEQCTD